MPDRTYRIREFAQLAGVTVRTLHHYDRLGLLKPRRTQTGYRAYDSQDLEILEQIVALKFIGLSLDEIKPLLRKNRTHISTALRAQRTLLDQKKRLLERAIAAISKAETTLQAADGADAEVFRQIIEVIEMQNKSEEWKATYDTLVQGKIERLKSMSPETKAQLQRQWADLFQDVEAALNEDPASETAQNLADRWATLLSVFAPGGASADPQVLKNFGANYPPNGEWPIGVRKLEGLMADRRIWDFIRRALAVRS